MLTQLTPVQITITTSRSPFRILDSPNHKPLSGLTTPMESEQKVHHVESEASADR